MSKSSVWLLASLALLLSGCGKALNGTYVAGRGDAITFTSSANWTSDSGMAGTYKIDGDTVILSGLPFGMSLSGQIEGDTVTIIERNMMTGQPRPKKYVKR